LADTYTYIVEALGEQAPNILSFIGTGGIGGVVKYGAGKAVKAGIAKKLHGLALTQGGLITKAQRAQLAKKMPGKGQFGKGQKAGVAAAAYTMGVGEVGNELREGGIDSPLTALVAAVPFAALDTLAFQSHIGRIFKGIDKGIATQSIKDIAKSIFRAAGLGAAAESSTEMLQEVNTLSARASGGGTTAIQSAYGKLTAPRETVPGDIDPQPTPPDAGGPPPPSGGRVPPAPPAPPAAESDLAPPVDERPQPPPAPAPEITEFEQIEADAGHAPQLAEVEPAMLATEAKINAYEALRMCLAR